MLLKDQGSRPPALPLAAGRRVAWAMARVLAAANTKLKPETSTRSARLFAVILGRYGSLGNK